MIGAAPPARARVRSLERLGSDLVARGQLWLWNQTADAIPPAVQDLATTAMNHESKTE